MLAVSQPDEQLLMPSWLLPTLPFPPELPPPAASLSPPSQAVFYDVFTLTLTGELNFDLYLLFSLLCCSMFSSSCFTSAFFLLKKEKKKAKIYSFIDEQSGRHLVSQFYDICLSLLQYAVHKAFPDDLLYRRWQIL